jgi:urease accessory protein UreE
MALEEVSVVDKVEVLLNGNIQVRRRDQILKDGVEVAASFHRHVVSPGDDLTGQDPKVVAIAEATWTPEVIAAYQASVEAAINTPSL